MKFRSKITYIDTNFVLRLLLNDIPSQTAIAQKLFEEINQGKIKGMISLLVLGEIIWVFENFYKRKRLDFIPMLSQLISLKHIQIIEINKHDVLVILDTMLKSNLDLTDLYLLHFGKRREIEIASFDKNLLKAQLQ